MVRPNQVLRVQFEELTALNIDDPILTIIRWFESNVVQDTFNNMAAKGLPIYIFLDEFQGVDNWNSQLKHIIDHGECKIFITGSSALRIHAGKESMAGRVQWNEINTLGLSEISAFRKLGVLPPCCPKIDLSEWLKKEFWINLKKCNWKHGNKPMLLDDVYENFCDFGGYPFCHTDKDVSWEDAEDYLYDTVVAKTIELDLKAKFESMLGGSVAFMDVTLLTNAFKTLCKYTGHDISIDKLREELNASHSINLKHDQIRKILEFFELSMLIKVVKPFEHRLKNPKENVKICLCDHAIRRAWLKEDVPLYGTNANSDLAGYIIEGIIGTFFKSIKNLGVRNSP